LPEVTISCPCRIGMCLSEKASVPNLRRPMSRVCSGCRAEVGGEC
jgi:hypothetical protein